MSSGWQEVAAQQAEEVSARLRQLLITGLGLLRSELGLELGLEPQKYPSWVFLVVPVSLGLFFLFLLLHCATSRGTPHTKRVPHHEKEQVATQVRVPVPNKIVKVEEPKKKNKKKPASEKAKPNGRPVELAEEVVIPVVKKEIPKQQQQPLEADKKNEKIKKNKKKPKPDTKPTQSSATQDKKEAEEGNWETKISNKEKRQQRKRDKGAEGDVSASETTTSVVESFTVISTQSTNIRKSKGQNESSALNGSSWNEKPTKVIPSQIAEEKWVTATNTAGKKKAEPWNQDGVDSNGKEWGGAPWSDRSIFPGIATWTSVNSSDQRSTFSTIGLNNSVSVSDSVPQTSATDNQWEATPAEPIIDDEWSGLNGVNSADPSSDWNAPAEEWGNYGEEEGPGPQNDEPEQDASKVSDDDKEKDDQGAQTGSGKAKKKKKKKKKQGEESGSPTEETESTKDPGNDYKQNSVPTSITPVIPTVVAKSNEQKSAKGNEQKSAKSNEQKSAKNNEQKSAKNSEQKSPKNNEQKVAKNNEQKAAKSNEQKAAKSNEQKSPKNNEQKAVKNNEPKAAKSNEPKAAKNNEPKAVKNNEPKAAKSGDQKAVKSNDQKPAKNDQKPAKSSEQKTAKTNEQKTAKTNEQKAPKSNEQKAPKSNEQKVTKSNEQKEKQSAHETRLHTVFNEAPVSAKHSNSEKSPPQAKQPQETNTSVTKQNSVAPPSQAKSEESWESPKQVKKKKKARRET